MPYLLLTITGSRIIYKIMPLPVAWETFKGYFS